MKFKEKIEDLAILGGPALFNEKLHVGKPNIGDTKNLHDRIEQILKNNWLTNNGPFLQEFEQKVSRLLGVKHFISVTNGTLGLEISAKALGLTGEVIVPSFTFVATPHSLRWLGLSPVFCDVDPRTHNIDPNKVESLITSNTSAILGVHVWGRPCDVQALQFIADKYNLKLYFDAAHAFGCSYQGKMIGNFGSAEIFSFHATKFFNTFEGGGIATNDGDIAANLKLMRNFGFSGYDKVVSLGINAKMSEVSAAMGLTGLESLDEFVAVNYRNYKYYMTELSSIDGIELVVYDESEKNNYQYVVVEIDSNKTGLIRDQIVKILHSENILARRYFYPGCHQVEPYKESGNGAVHLPATEILSQKVISLPTGSHISQREIKKICSIIRFSIENAGAIQNKIAI